MSHIVHEETFDLFLPISQLGQSNASVDAVVRPDRSGYVYARKRFVLPEDRASRQMETILRELAVMRRLKHRHIVQLVGSYEWSNLFYILMKPVAEENLSSYFRRVENLAKDEPDRADCLAQMRRWAACLFRALDYVHHMRIRHKDVKPANILIKDKEIYLADFGLANDFEDLSTSRTAGAATGTEEYMSPELSREDRRGRASDVWALGCVLLELCTVYVGAATLESFADRRRENRKGRGAAAYYHSPFILFDWIWLHMGSSGSGPAGSPHSHSLFVPKALQLAFLMLDPNPQMRITARQLVDLVSDPRSGDFQMLGNLACEGCWQTRGKSPQDIPLHSVFRQNTAVRGQAYRPEKTGLGPQTEKLWEEVKVRWLLSHIWWVTDDWLNQG